MRTSEVYKMESTALPGGKCIRELQLTFRIRLHIMILEFISNE